MNLRDALALIRDIPDFPKPGVVFKDLSPLLENPRAFEALIDAMAESVTEFRPQKLAAIEARGFIYAAPLAYRLKTGLVLIRKKGKLPAQTFKQSYALEYGSDEIEMHQDAVLKDERIALVDDVLATGGTLAAAQSLISQAQGVVCGIQVVMELGFLRGRERLGKTPVRSIL